MRALPMTRSAVLAGRTAADALGRLCMGGPTATGVWHALAWIVGLLAVSVPAAVAAYRRATIA